MEDEATSTGQAFNAVLIIEGERTTDDREIQPGALSWRELPIPITNAEMTGEDHQGVVVGRIETIQRVGSEIRATGVFDLGSEAGRETARLVAEQLKRWVSVDMEVTSYDLFEEGDCQIDESPDSEIDFYPPADCHLIMRVTEGRIMGAAICAFPAFPGAVIIPADDALPPATENGRPATAAGEWVIPWDNSGTSTTPLTWTTSFNSTNPSPELVAVLKGEEPKMEPILAHALNYPTEPPADWFTDPTLDEPTPITVTAEGRIYGHAALWDSCHVGRPGICTAPPKSASNYAYYRTGSVACPDGCAIPTGRITLNTGHADLDLDAYSAAAHYDHTGAAVADVATGEDEYGIWFAGALRPNVNDEQVRILRASSLSGDWRPIGGQLELVGLLAVNVPGFPIARPLAASGVQVRVIEGVQTALVAAAGPSPEHPLLTRLAKLEARLTAVESVARPLRGQAAAEIRRSVTG